MHSIRLMAAALAAAQLAAPVAAELPAPEMIGAFPADQEEVEAPLDAITLIFAATTDLVEVAIITPDERRFVLHDAATADEELKDVMFVLSLPEAITVPGTYKIKISASVSDPSDSSSSAISTTNSFTLTEAAPAGEPQAASFAEVKPVSEASKTSHSGSHPPAAVSRADARSRNLPRSFKRGFRQALTFGNLPHS